jgi:hypothetical protein
MLVSRDIYVRKKLTTIFLIAFILMAIPSRVLIPLAVILSEGSSGSATMQPHDVSTLR